MKKLEEGIGLSVSGGGFRASLFHAGSLWRLNELGYLKKLKRICSVSGGSITSALLGCRWKQLEFDEHGVATDFHVMIAKPIQDICSRTLDIPATLRGWITPWRPPAAQLAQYYDKYLFKSASLQDLPDDSEGPRFIIYATSVQTGASVRFSKPYIAEYHLGKIRNPSVSIATAVAASSAFPPLFTPLTMKFDPNSWEQLGGADLHGDIALKRTLHLTDGGVYDNLGLEANWQRFSTVLVSDAGRPMGIRRSMPLLRVRPITKMKRVIDISMEQVRALRARRLVGDFIKGNRAGTYWGIATNIDEYDLSDAMIKDNDLTKSLQNVRTRLGSFTNREQGLLINWGYALTDAAMRKYVIKGPQPPGQWPMAKYPL